MLVLSNSTNEVKAIMVDSDGELSTASAGSMT